MPSIGNAGIKSTGNMRPQKEREKKADYFLLLNELPHLHRPVTL